MFQQFLGQLQLLRRLDSNLWFSRVLVGLDEDLADADVFANGPQSGLHGLPSTEDGHAGDLRGIKTAQLDKINVSQMKRTPGCD